MRRFLLPATVLAIAIIASVLAASADDAADPDDPPADTETGSLVTPLLSVRRTPEWLRQPTTRTLLDTAVAEAVAPSTATAFVCASVHVGGASVTELASDVPFIPGESARILTLAALGTVGGGGFTTEVARTAGAEISESGELQGDLWLIGGADPVLSTDAYISRFDDGRAFTSLEELALTTVAALRDAGITSVAGRVVGVDPKYDGTPQVFSSPDGRPAWTGADIASGVVGLTSGLLVDNGFASFAPDSVDPTANRTAANAITHAAGEFRDVLEALGLPVAGGVAEGDATSAAAQQTVASIESPPLAEIAARALVDGTTAEMLWREIAVRRGLLLYGPLAGINAALVELELLTAEEAGNYPKFDGSGLSLLSKARCDTLTGVLDLPAPNLAAGALPAVADSPLADCAPTSFESLHVAVATRPEVTSMAGRAVAPNGETITFSVLANWLPDAGGAYAPRAACDELLPSVLAALAAYPAGSLDELTPLASAE